MRKLLVFSTYQNSTGSLYRDSTVFIYLSGQCCSVNPDFSQPMLTLPDRVLYQPCLSHCLMFKTLFRVPAVPLFAIYRTKNAKKKNPRKFGAFLPVFSLVGSWDAQTVIFRRFFSSMFIVKVGLASNYSHGCGSEFSECTSGFLFLENRFHGKKSSDPAPEHKNVNVLSCFSYFSSILH